MAKRKKIVQKVQSAIASMTEPTTPPVLDDAEGDLIDDLLAQLESRDGQVQAESAKVLNSMHLEDKADIVESSTKQDAKTRYKARQARKAAALAERYTEDDPAAEAKLEREAKEELAEIQRVCVEQGLQLVEINPDGHCLYSAIADQLALLGLLPPAQATYAAIRQVAANYIYSHPDDFVPFLPSTGGEDSVGAYEAGIMTPSQFENYCKAIQNTATWGGEPEIMAICKAFKVPIHVVQGGRPPVVEHHPTGGVAKRGEAVVKISYHRRLYGLGEHYNSLRPIPQPTKRLIVPMNFS